MNVREGAAARDLSAGLSGRCALGPPALRTVTDVERPLPAIVFDLGTVLPTLAFRFCLWRFCRRFQ